MNSLIISGAYGGHTIDFRRFAADGITLLGRVLAARDGVLDIAPGLAGSLADGDSSFAFFLNMLDAFVEQSGLDLPDDPAARRCSPTRLASPHRCALDLAKEGIAAVIWATGYGVDFGWIDVPVLDARASRFIAAASPQFPGFIFSACNGCRKCTPPSCPASATMPPCSPTTSPPAAEDALAWPRLNPREM